VKKGSDTHLESQLEGIFMNVCSFIVHLDWVFFNHGKTFIYKTVIFGCSIE